MSKARKANKALRVNGLSNFKIESKRNKNHEKIYTLYKIDGSGKQSMGYSPLVRPLFDEICMSLNNNPAAQQRVQEAKQLYMLTNYDSDGLHIKWRLPFNKAEPTSSTSNMPGLSTINHVVGSLRHIWRHA